MRCFLFLHPWCSTGHRALHALALGLMAMPAWSAPAGLSFDTAVDVATAQAPMLAARRAQVAAAREEVARAAALPDPQLTLGLANWPVTGAEAFDLRSDEMTTKQIGVMQSFPARAKRQARRLLSESTVDQADALALAERQIVRQAAAEAWIALWAAQQELDALQALREPARIAIDTAKARLSGGSGTVTDTLATQSAWLALENRIDAAKIAVEVARAGLARWLGRPATDIEPAGAPPELTRLPVAEATLLSSIDRQGPLLAWRSREALADAEVTAAIAEKRPDWSLGITYGQRDRAPDGMPRSDMLMVEFAVGLPVFGRNRQDRGIAARRAEREAVLAERDEARRVQLEGVGRTLAQWRGLQRQITRQQNETLPVARDRARTALAAYAGGADLQPWLEARRDEIELHIEHARLAGELGRAWVALAYLLPLEENSP